MTEIILNNKKHMKTSFTVYMLAFMASFFTPIYPAMIAVGSLIILDTLFGIAASKKRNEKLSSRKFSRLLTKLLAYNFLIISAHIVTLYLVASLPLVKITLGFLAVNEFLSISESFSVLTNMNFVAFIKSYLNNFIDGLKSKQEKDPSKDES